MGLFDRLVRESEVVLTPQGGLLLAALTMVAADGDVDDDELAIIRRLDGSGRTTDWDAAVKVWRKSSTEEAIVKATESMNRDQRLVAIANLVDIAMADAVLAGEEESLLEAYVAAFNLEQSMIAGIVEVISIKNNRSIFYTGA